MKFTPLKVAGAFLIEEEPRRDARGDLARVFCQREFEAHGLVYAVAQMNRSRTHRRGTVRGLHYQIPPHAEAKLFRCTRGSLVHVMADMRHGSETFLQWHAERLTADNGKIVYVPPGVAHGIQTLEDDVETTYMTSSFYAPEHERGCRWDDPRLAIAWPIGPADVILSEKDAGYAPLGMGFSGVRL